MNMYNQVVAEKDALLLKPELAASPNPIHLSSPPQLPLPMQPTPDVPIQTSREEPSMIPPKKTVSDANNDQKREEEHKKTSPVKSPKESPEVAVKTEVLKLMEHISKPAQPHPASVSPANRVIYESPSQIVEDLPSPKSTPDPVFLVQTMAPLQTTRSEVPVQSPLPSSHQDALASPEETNLEEVDEEDKPLSRAASELLLVSNAQDDANDPVINMSKIKNIKFDLVNGFAHEPILPNVSNRIPLEDATQTVILPICHQCQYYQDIHI